MDSQGADMPAQRGPLPAYRAILTGRGVGAAALDEIERNAREAVDRATEEAKAAPCPGWNWRARTCGPTAVTPGGIRLIPNGQT